MDKLFFLLVIVVGLSSCAGTSYFQMYDLESEDLEFTDDGLHLNEYAYALWAELVKNLVNF